MKDVLCTKSVLGALRSLREYKELSDTLSKFSRTGIKYSQGLCYVCGISDGMCAALCADLVLNKNSVCNKENENNTAIILVPDEKTAYKMQKMLVSFGTKSEVLPARDYNLHNIATSSHEWEHERLRVLRLAYSKQIDAVIAVPESALGRLSNPEEIVRGLTVKIGDNMSLQSITDTLVKFGYERSECVEGQGQFAVRGDILDVFVPDYENPVRVEFFGDEIDASGFFDVLTQRRIENINELCITPLCEFNLDNEAKEKIQESIKTLITGAKRKKNDAAVQSLEKELCDFQSGKLYSLDKYLHLVNDKYFCLFDYAKGPCFVYNTPYVRDRLKAYLWQLEQDLVETAKQGLANIKKMTLCLDYEELKTKLYPRPCISTDFFSTTPDYEISGLFELNSKSCVTVFSNIALLCEDVKDYVKSGKKIQISTQSQFSANELSKILLDNGLQNTCVKSVEYEDMQKGYVYIVPKDEPTHKLCGFECAKANYVLLCDEKENPKEQTNKINSIKKQNKTNSKRVLSYLELTQGDYVVHDVHGIGLYEGIKTLSVAGITRDYITIKYLGNDCLYVPCDQLDKVSKFSGKNQGVRLSKMGSSDWTKTKTRVKQAAKEMAKELITLYAERSRRPGHAFSPDNEWQREFEDGFEYAETDGQLEAIRDIKRDMEKPCPMDRLLCGDVGFGKTEVALRAVFKCVMDGKQAAILVPTTVLCWQHYTTVLSRMHNFPVRVEMLSRYVSAKKAKQVLQQMKNGEVDIVVGTHKLLAKGVEFKNLGLLVIDEEQRFGVKHKETLKEMSKQVDVLTLTATPIPRTFNMALVGIRDMSLLEQAPIDRYPVQTYVLEHDDVIIAEAIKKELRRAGQVFYLHNKVEDIQNTANKIKQIAPDATVEVAHGKMSQEELSQIWKNVVEGKIDVLVCTTIIETGVDVPNANTLIIEDADKFGLSQLHQIRGRVGRSSRRAYAYLTWKKQDVISEIAQKRLTAIKEFTEFGSGFKIAMRDLEIRGAGNLLGAEQSGHMESVGYDMFIKLLEQAVLEEKGQEQEIKPECTMELGISAYIPEKYILRPSGRIEMYKRISAITDMKDADDVRDEMLDRYGDIPKETENLIKIALLKQRCQNAGFVKIERKDSKLCIYPQEAPSKDIVISIVSAFPSRVLVSMGKEPCFNIKLKIGEDITPILEQIFKIYSHEKKDSVL